MRTDAIDNILAKEASLAPLSGFLAAVMERVKEEAAAPAPIPFPFKRALPGMILAGGVFGWGTVAMLRELRHASLTMPHMQVPASLAGPLEAAGWLTVAMGLSLASWLLSRRIWGGASLY